MTARRGFTLVELLVVVAIVAVLLAIVLPGLSQVRGQAEIVSCRSNLSQVGLATYAYAMDHREAIPFGPDLSSITFVDFYRFPGMVTSIVSTRSGEPVGLGLLLDVYLANQREVLFCPGSDQPVVASDELAKFKTDQVQSSYWYRHGSAAVPRDPVLAIRLNSELKNRDGHTVRAIVMDTNFVAPPEQASFGIYTRTHHQQKVANALYLDGSVAGHENTDDRFTANVGSTPQDGPTLILDAFEEADLQR